MAQAPVEQALVYRRNANIRHAVADFTYLSAMVTQGRLLYDQATHWTTVESQVAIPMFGKIAKKLAALLGDSQHGSGSEREQPPPLPSDNMSRHDFNRKFSSEMFAQLLLELPDHRTSLVTAHGKGDIQEMRDHVHKLLGAVVYCDAADLETGLRELRLALKTGNRETIDHYFLQAIGLIDLTLGSSGYRSP